MGSRWLLRLGLLVLAGATWTAAPTEPRIPPGYQPADDRDERGLWDELDEYEQSLRRSPLLVDDPQLNAYVRDVVCRIAGDYCPDLRVYVLRNPGFNAMMAPNGMMVVWTGLLIRVGSEDELAAVVGHELAHYTMAHSLQQFRHVRATMGLGTLLSTGVAVVTGVFAPIGELAALLDALAFSRKQEAEADLLGARYLQAAGYDPRASYTVWESLLAEEEAAVVARDEPLPFMRTHPAIRDRLQALQTWADAQPAPAARRTRQDRHRRVLTGLYFELMEDQIDTNRYGRTSFLLERHAELGVDPALIAFFRGEMYRQRAGDGDGERAAEAYLEAIKTGHAPPEAFRNLGYLKLKAGDRDTARQLFSYYLALAPKASDRAMIEFYLEE